MNDNKEIFTCDFISLKTKKGGIFVPTNGYIGYINPCDNENE